MTIEKILAEIANLKPDNTASDGDLIRWISVIDGSVYRDLIRTHADAPNIFEEPVYDEDTPIDTELLIPDNFSDVYIYYLASMIDFANGETKKYNNDRTLYADAYSEYRRWYHRTHKSLPNRVAYF